MRREILFVFLLCLLLVLGSCDSYYGHSEFNENWRTGTEGVEVSFMGDNFLYNDNAYMELQIMVQNKGAYDEPQGKVVVSGYDPSVVFLRSDEVSLPHDFLGINPYDDEGTIYFLEFEEDAPLAVSLGDTYEANLQASVCYTYQTVALPAVCLLYDPDDDFICSQDLISLSSQGGPVAVSAVDQTYMQDQVRFTVTIDHVGDGMVLNAYDVDAYEACPFTLEREHLGYVGVDMLINGLDEPSCVPSNKYVKLNDQGQGVIVCTFTLREPRSYETPLEITLDYSYLSTVEQDVLVVKPDPGVEREVPDYWGSSSSSVGGSSGSGGECYCSEANMNIWGGCVCLHIGGQEHYCLEGSTQIPISGTVGDTLDYEVYGSSTVVTCGDGPSPMSSCPFDGAITVSGTTTNLEIYGTTVDGRTVSERCSLVLQ